MGHIIKKGPGFRGHHKLDHERRQQVRKQTRREAKICSFIQRKNSDLQVQVSSTAIRRTSDDSLMQKNASLPL